MKISPARIALLITAITLFASASVHAEFVPVRTVTDVGEYKKVLERPLSLGCYGPTGELGRMRRGEISLNSLWRLYRAENRVAQLTRSLASKTLRRSAAANMRAELNALNRAIRSCGSFAQSEFNVLPTISPGSITPSTPTPRPTSTNTPPPRPTATPTAPPTPTPTAVETRAVPTPVNTSTPTRQGTVVFIPTDVPTVAPTPTPTLAPALTNLAIRVRHDGDTVDTDEGITIVRGQPLEFTATVRGGRPRYRIQWYRDGLRLGNGVVGDNEWFFTPFLIETSPSDGSSPPVSTVKFPPMFPPVPPMVDYTGSITLFVIDQSFQTETATFPLKVVWPKPEFPF